MDDKTNPPPPPDATTDFTPAPSSPEPVIGTLGRFQLRQELGRGAFGVVYRAHDPILDREVAVKVPLFTAHEPALRERFLREARTAARLRHPNIVTVHDCGFDGEQVYIAYELVQGVPLSDRLAAERPNPRQAAQWIRALALALHHAHEQGVLHRDVKPANILIEAGNRPRLTDFGISKDISGPPPAPSAGAADPVLTRDGVIVGTPAYMAPEQARGDAAALGPHTDQYGLGVLLYELLTGRRPFTGTAAEVIAQVTDPLRLPPPPREVAPAIALGLEAVVLKAIARDPAGRYATCADVAVDLQRWLNGDPVSAPVRVPEGWVLRCPECGLGTPPPATACKFCGHALAGAEPTEPSKALRQEAPEREPFWTSQLLLSAGQWVVWLLLVAASVAVFVVNWRVAVMQAGGWDVPHPSFLDTFPLVKGLGQLGRGIVLGVAGVGVGLVAALAWINTERARSFVELARWASAASAVLLAVLVETTTRYPQSTRYRLEVTVQSAGGRVVKNTRVRVMQQTDRERPLSERRYIDEARLRAFDPGRDSGARPWTFTGVVSYSRSPLGFVFNPNPDRIVVVVGYEDDTVGSCQCDDGVGIGFRHDHHTLAFPLRRVVDATPATVRPNWSASLTVQEANPVRVTIEVP
jgi:hypothetical protein